MKATQSAEFVPDVVPVLSSGKHRNPRKGACFMEMASYLAGEKWSDHPACTHPLLASLARLINDSLTDQDRPRIVGLVPDVVGITGTALEMDLAIAMRAASAALPVAPAVRQNVLAVGLLTSRRLAKDLASERPGQFDDLIAMADAALAAAPEARRWALRFGKDGQVSERTFRRQTAPHLVAFSVEGISVACVDDVPARLVALLSSTIRDAATRVDRSAPVAPVPTSRLERVRSLVR